VERTNYLLPFSGLSGSAVALFGKLAETESQIQLFSPLGPMVSPRTRVGWKKKRRRKRKQVKGKERKGWCGKDKANIGIQVQSLCK
jgi:hypothetical protein